jgi:hypothetical protein
MDVCGARKLRNVRVQNAKLIRQMFHSGELQRLFTQTEADRSGKVDLRKLQGRLRQKGHHR